MNIAHLKKTSNHNDPNGKVAISKNIAHLKKTSNHNQVFPAARVASNIAHLKKTSNHNDITFAYDLLQRGAKVQKVPPTAKIMKDVI